LLSFFIFNKIEWILEKSRDRGYKKLPFMSRRNLFDPESSSPFKLSRTKIEEFLECPRCFYLDVRLGVARPPWPPFTLNSAIDHLLKKEFDIHRANGEKHPLMKAYGIEALPLKSEKIDEWRNKGIFFHHKESNFLVWGRVDDVWVDEEGNLIIVDYKATNTSQEVTLDGEYKDKLKREVEIYQWLFRKNGFSVSEVAYFVYCNANTDREAFDGKLEFEVQIIPYKGNDEWIEPTLLEIKKCLEKEEIPSASPSCPYCRYRQQAMEKEKEFES